MGRQRGELSDIRDDGDNKNDEPRHKGRRDRDSGDSRGGSGGGEQDKGGGGVRLFIQNVGGSLTVLLQIALFAWGIRQLRSVLAKREENRKMRQRLPDGNPAQCIVARLSPTAALMLAGCGSGKSGSSGSDGEGVDAAAAGGRGEAAAGRAGSNGQTGARHAAHRRGGRGGGAAGGGSG